MMRWFHALMPRDERFFDLFERHARVLVAGAQSLRAMLDGGEAVTGHCRAVLAREREADEVTREILIAVRRTFITPIDRMDIKDLIRAMDDAIDKMEQTAKSIILFELRTFMPQMQMMGDSIVQAAGLVCEAMPLLRAINSEVPRLSRITEQIRQIEGQAEEIHDAGLKELYQTRATSDLKSFVIGQEVYGHLEQALDRFDDVADEISSVVIDQV